MGRNKQPVSYYQPQYFSATLRGGKVEYGSKPGLPSWDEVTPASLLLAEGVEAGAAARILLLGCGHGALGVALARLAPQGQLLLSDSSVVAITMARETLRHNQLTNATVASDPTTPPEREGYDVVAMELPKGRALTRRWLLEAHAALRPGGKLYLAGAGDEGVEPAIADARALFGGAVVTAYKKGSRLAVATRREPGASDERQPDWAREPGIAPGTWRRLQLDLAGRPLELKSLPGVFAYDHLDEGTALLLQTLPPLAGARALDLGCGYGVIGVALALAGAAHVDMVDASLLAVACARQNCADLALEHASAYPSDALAAISATYDAIVTNPPFHAGRAVTFDITETFIAGAREHLRPGGALILVANSFIRYDRKLHEAFGNVETLASNGKYHVLRSERR